MNWKQSSSCPEKSTVLAFARFTKFILVVYLWMNEFFWLFFLLKKLLVWAVQALPKPHPASLPLCDVPVADKQARRWLRALTQGHLPRCSRDNQLQIQTTAFGAVTHQKTVRADVAEKLKTNMRATAEGRGAADRPSVFMVAVSTMPRNWAEPAASPGPRTLSTFSPTWHSSVCNGNWTILNDPDALHGKKMERKKMNGILHFVLHRVDLACFPFIVYEFGVLEGGSYSAR